MADASGVSKPSGTVWLDEHNVDIDDVDVDDSCAVAPAGVRSAAWVQVWVYVPATDATDDADTSAASDAGEENA